MALAESIFAKLSDSASATAAIAGAGDACRVYPEIAPANTQRPYAIVNEIATQIAATHGEAAGNRYKLIQVSCFAETAAGAKALRDAVVSDLDAQTLSNGDNPTLEDERSGYEQAVDLHRADADFLI